MKYRVFQGPFQPAIEIEIAGVPPCMFCGMPVTLPSMDGPLVCGPCDCGCNPDGTPWTPDQARVRQAHRRARCAEYRDRAAAVTAPALLQEVP